MSKLIRYLSVFLLLTCSFVLGVQSATPQTPNVPVAGAITLDLSGSVVIHDPAGNESKARRGAVLAEGSSIETSTQSTILLRLHDGSEVLLGARSRLLLKSEPQQTGVSQFQLLLGKLRAVVTKRFSGTPSFQLGTPTAIIAVRGTQFNVEVNGHEVTEVDVDEGTVQVSGRNDASNSVLVKPGFSTRVGPDMIPEAPFSTDLVRPDPRQRQQQTENGPNGLDTRQQGASPQSEQNQEGPDKPNLL